MKSHDWIFLMFTTIICCMTIAQAQQRGRVKFGMSLQKDATEKSPEIVNPVSQAPPQRASSRFRAAKPSANPSAIPATIDEVISSPRSTALRGSRGRSNDRSSRKLTAEATEAIPLVRSRKRIVPVPAPAISNDQPTKVELPVSTNERTNVIRRSKTRSEPSPTPQSSGNSRRRSDTLLDEPTESIRKVRTFTSRSVTKQVDEVVSSETPLTVATTGSSWRNVANKRGSAKSKTSERTSKALQFEDDQLEDENYPEHFKLLLKKQQPSPALLPKNYPKLPVQEEPTYSKLNEVYEAPRAQARLRRLEQPSRDRSDDISRVTPRDQLIEVKREDIGRIALRTRRIEPPPEIKIESEFTDEKPKSRRSDAEKLRAQLKINKAAIKLRKKEPVQNDDERVPYKPNRRSETSTEGIEVEVKPNEIEEATKSTKSLFLPRRAEPYRPKPKTTTQRPTTTPKHVKKPEVLEARAKFKNRFRSRLQFPSLKSKSASSSEEIQKLDNEVVQTSPAPQQVRPLQITKSKNVALDRPIVDPRTKPKQHKFSSRYRGDAFSRYQQKTEPSKPIYTPTIPALTTEPTPRQLEPVYPNNLENLDLNKPADDLDGIIFDGSAGAWNMVEPIPGGLTRSEISVDSASEDQQLLPQSSVTVSIYEALAEILSKTPTTTTSTTTTTTTTTSTTELPDIIQVPEQKIDSISSSTVNTHNPITTDVMDDENPTTTIATNDFITNNDRNGRLLSNSVDNNNPSTISPSSEYITVPQNTQDTTLLFRSPSTEQTINPADQTTLPALPTQPTLINTNLTNISTKLLELTTLDSNPPTSLPMPFLSDVLTTPGSSLITQPQLISAISNFLDTSVQNASETMATTTITTENTTTATLDANSTLTTFPPPITTTLSPTSTESPPVTISFLDLFTIQAKKVNQNTEPAVEVHPIYKGPEATTTPIDVVQKKSTTTGRPVNINTFFGTQTYPTISVTGSTSTDRSIKLSRDFAGVPTQVTGGVTDDTTIPSTETSSTLDYTTIPQTSSIRTKSLPIHLNNILGSTQKYDQTSPIKTVQTEITTTIRSRFGNRRIPILPAGTVQKTTTATQTSSTTTPISTTSTIIVTPVYNQPELLNITTTTEQNPIQDFSIYGILPNNTVVRKRPPQVSRQLDIGVTVYGILPNQTVVRKYPNGTLMIVDSSKDVEVVDIDPKMLFNPFSELYRTSQSSFLLTTHRSTTSHRLIENNHILSSTSSSSSTEVPNSKSGGQSGGNSIKETTESGNTDSTLSTNTDDENLIQWLSENEDNILNSTILVESNTENAVLLDLLKRKYIKTDLPLKSSNVVSLTTVRNMIDENSIPKNKQEDNTLFDSSEEKKKDSLEDFIVSKASVVPVANVNNNNNDDENDISQKFDTSYGVGSIFASNNNQGSQFDNTSQVTQLPPLNNSEMAFENTSTKLFPINTLTSMHTGNNSQNDSTDAVREEFLDEVVNRTHGEVVDNLSMTEFDGFEMTTPKRDGESKFIDFGILESEVDSETNGDYFMDPEDRLRVIDDGFDFDTDDEGSGSNYDIDENGVTFGSYDSDDESGTTPIVGDFNTESPFVQIVFPEGVIDSSEKFTDIYTTVSPLKNSSTLFQSENLLPSLKATNTSNIIADGEAEITTTLRSTILDEVDVEKAVLNRNSSSELDKKIETDVEIVSTRLHEEGGVGFRNESIIHSSSDSIGRDFSNNGSQFETVSEVNFDSDSKISDDLDSPTLVNDSSSAQESFNNSASVDSVLKNEEIHFGGNLSSLSATDSSNMSVSIENSQSIEYNNARLFEHDFVPNFPIVVENSSTVLDSFEPNEKDYVKLNYSNSETVFGILEDHKISTERTGSVSEGFSEHDFGTNFTNVLKNSSTVLNTTETKTTLSEEMSEDNSKLDNLNSDTVFEIPNEHNIYSESIESLLENKTVAPMVHDFVISNSSIVDNSSTVLNTFEASKTLTEETSKPNLDSDLLNSEFKSNESVRKSKPSELLEDDFVRSFPSQVEYSSTVSNTSDISPTSSDESELEISTVPTIVGSPKGISKLESESVLGFSKEQTERNQKVSETDQSEIIEEEFVSVFKNESSVLENSSSETRMTPPQESEVEISVNMDVDSSSTTSSPFEPTLTTASSTIEPTNENVKSSFFNFEKELEIPKPINFSTESSEGGIENKNLETLVVENPKTLSNVSEPIATPSQDSKEDISTGSFNTGNFNNEYMNSETVSTSSNERHSSTESIGNEYHEKNSSKDDYMHSETVSENSNERHSSESIGNKNSVNNSSKDTYMNSETVSEDLNGRNSSTESIRNENNSSKDTFMTFEKVSENSNERHSSTESIGNENRENNSSDKKTLPLDLEKKNMNSNEDSLEDFVISQFNENFPSKESVPSDESMLLKKNNTEGFLSFENDSIIHELKPIIVDENVKSEMSTALDNSVRISENEGVENINRDQTKMPDSNKAVFNFDVSSTTLADETINGFYNSPTISPDPDSSTKLSSFDIQLQKKMMSTTEWDIESEVKKTDTTVKPAPPTARNSDEYTHIFSVLRKNHPRAKARTTTSMPETSTELSTSTSTQNSENMEIEESTTENSSREDQESKNDENSDTLSFNIDSSLEANPKGMSGQQEVHEIPRDGQLNEIMKIKNVSYVYPVRTENMEEHTSEQSSPRTESPSEVDQSSTEVAKKQYEAEEILSSQINITISNNTKIEEDGGFVKDLNSAERPNEYILTEKPIQLSNSFVPTVRTSYEEDHISEEVRGKIENPSVVDQSSTESSKGTSGEQNETGQSNSQNSHNGINAVGDINEDTAEELDQSHFTEIADIYTPENPIQPLSPNQTKTVSFFDDFENYSSKNWTSRNDSTSTKIAIETAINIELNKQILLSVFGENSTVQFDSADKDNEEIVLGEHSTTESLSTVSNVSESIQTTKTETSNIFKSESTNDPESTKSQESHDMGGSSNLLNGQNVDRNPTSVSELIDLNDFEISNSTTSTVPDFAHDTTESTKIIETTRIEDSSKLENNQTIPTDPILVSENKDFEVFNSTFSSVSDISPGTTESSRNIESIGTDDFSKLENSQDADRSPTSVSELKDLKDFEIVNSTSTSVPDFSPGTTESSTNIKSTGLEDYSKQVNIQNTAKNSTTATKSIDLNKFNSSDTFSNRSASGSESTVSESLGNRLLLPEINSHDDPRRYNETDTVLSGTTERNVPLEEAEMSNMTQSTDGLSNYETLNVDEFLQQFEEQENSTPNPNNENESTMNTADEILEVGFENESKILKPINATEREKVGEILSISVLDAPFVVLPTNNSFELTNQSGYLGKEEILYTNLENITDTNSYDTSSVNGSINDPYLNYDDTFDDFNVDEKLDSHDPLSPNSFEGAVESEIPILKVSNIKVDEDSSTVSGMEPLTPKELLSLEPEKLKIDDNSSKISADHGTVPSLNSGLSDDNPNYPDQTEQPGLEMEVLNTRSQISLPENNQSSPGSQHFEQISSKDILSNAPQVDQYYHTYTENPIHSTEAARKDLEVVQTPEVFHLNHVKLTKIKTDHDHPIAEKTMNTFVENSRGHESPISNSASFDQDLFKSPQVLEAVIPQIDLSTKSVETTLEFKDNEARNNSSPEQVWISSISSEIIEKETSSEMPPVKSKNEEHSTSQDLGSSAKHELLKTLQNEYPGVIEVEFIDKSLSGKIPLDFLNENKTTVRDSAVKFIDKSLSGEIPLDFLNENKTTVKDSAVEFIDKSLSGEIPLDFLNENKTTVKDSAVEFIDKSLSGEIPLDFLNKNKTTVRDSAVEFIDKSLSGKIPLDYLNESKTTVRDSAAEFIDKSLSGKIPLDFLNENKTSGRDSTDWDNSEKVLLNKDGLEIKGIIDPSHSSKVNEQSSSIKSSTEVDIHDSKTSSPSEPETIRNTFLDEGNIPAHIRIQLHSVSQLGRKVETLDKGSERPVPRPILSDTTTSNTNNSPNDEETLRSAHSQNLIYPTISEDDKATSEVDSNNSSVLPNQYEGHSANLSSFSQIQEDTTENADSQSTSEAPNFVFSPLNIIPLQKIYVPTGSAEKESSNFQISSPENNEGLSATPRPIENLRVENTPSRTDETGNQYANIHSGQQESLLDQKIEDQSSIVSPLFKSEFQQQSHFSTHTPVLQSASQILEPNTETSSASTGTSKADKDKVSKIILDLINKSDQDSQNVANSRPNTLSPNSLSKSQETYDLSKSSADSNFLVREFSFPALRQNLPTPAEISREVSVHSEIGENKPKESFQYLDIQFPATERFAPTSQTIKKTSSQPKENIRQNEGQQSFEYIDIQFPATVGPKSNTQTVKITTPQPKEYARHNERQPSFEYVDIKFPATLSPTSNSQTIKSVTSQPKEDNRQNEEQQSFEYFDVKFPATEGHTSNSQIIKNTTPQPKEDIRQNEGQQSFESVDIQFPATVGPTSNSPTIKKPTHQPKEDIRQAEGHLDIQFPATEGPKSNSQNIKNTTPQPKEDIRQHEEQQPFEYFDIQFPATEGPTSDSLTIKHHPKEDIRKSEREQSFRYLDIKFAATQKPTVIPQNIKNTTPLPAKASTYPPITPNYEQYTKPPSVFYPVNSPPAVFYPVNSPKYITPIPQSKAAIVLPTNMQSDFESSTDSDQVAMVFPKDSMPTLNMELPGSLHQTYLKEIVPKPFPEIIPTTKKSFRLDMLPTEKSNHIKYTKESEFYTSPSSRRTPSFFEKPTTSKITATSLRQETKSNVESTTPSFSTDKVRGTRSNVESTTPSSSINKVQETGSRVETTTLNSPIEKSTEKSAELSAYVPGSVPDELMSNTESSAVSKKSSTNKFQSTYTKFVPGGIPREVLNSMSTFSKPIPVFNAETPLGTVFGHFPSNNVLPFEMLPTTTAAPTGSTENIFHKTYQFNLKVLKSTIEKVENDVKVLKETFIKSLNKSTNVVDPLEVSEKPSSAPNNYLKESIDFPEKPSAFNNVKSESPVRDNIAPIDQLDLLQESIDPALSTRSVSSNGLPNRVEDSKHSLQTMMKNSQFKPVNSNPLFKMSQKALVNAKTINSIMSESATNAPANVPKSNSKPFSKFNSQNQYETISQKDYPQRISDINNMEYGIWTETNPSEAHTQKYTETQYTTQKEHLYQESSTISSLSNSFVIDHFQNSINAIAEPNQFERKTTPTIYLVTPAPRTTTTTTEVPTTTTTTTPIPTTTTTSTTPSTTTTTTPSTTTTTTTSIPTTTTAATTTTTSTTQIPITFETTTSTTSRPTIIFKAPTTTSSTIAGPSQSPTNTDLIGANSELEKNIKLLEQLLKLQASLKTQPDSGSTTSTTTTSSTTPSTTTTRVTEAPIKVLDASSSDDEQFIKQLRQLLLSQQQVTKPTIPSTTTTTTSSTTTTTTTTPKPTTTTTTSRKPITISHQNLQDLLNSFSTPSFSTTSVRPNHNADDIQFLNSLREIGKIPITTSAPTTFANRIIELAIKNRPATPTSPVYISTTVPPFVRMPEVKIPQILPSNEIEQHKQDQASLSADLSLLSSLLGRRITIADLPQITQQFGANRVKAVPVPVPRRPLTTTTTTPRTTTRLTTTTPKAPAKPMTKDEIAEIQKNLALLSSLLGRPVSLAELPLIMQDLKAGRKPKGTATSGGATINFVTPMPFKPVPTVSNRATASPPISFPSQTPISQEEVIELLKDPNLGSPEQLNIYGQSNDAILAAVLKQRGIGPAHNNLPVNDLFTKEQSQKPYRPPRPTQPPPPPAPQRRPVLDGLAWLWRTWQDTAGPGNRVSKSTRQPTGSASTRLESPLLVGAFAGNDPTPTENSSDDGGEYADLQYPQNPPSFGQGNGLLTAAFGVTRAVSQFLGAAFQGAAKSVQSAFSPQAIQQPSLISLSG